MIILYVIIALVLAALRIVGIKTALFQAVGHLFVGLGFGVWFGDGKYYLYVLVAFVLSIIELCCFLIGVGS